MSNNDDKTALILEGGGAKGAFEAGVIQYIVDKEIKIDLVGGTSVGGLNAACFAFGKISDLMDLWRNISNEQVYNLNSLFKYILNWDFTKKLMTYIWNVPSILDNRPLEEKIKKLFGDLQIQESNKHPNIPLYITAFNLNSGEVDYFDSDSEVKVIDALMATSAIQIAFPVRKINRKYYIDGGNGANLPLRKAIDYECNRLILVRTNLPQKELEKDFNSGLEVMTRAYFSTFSQATENDIKFARNISDWLNKEKEKDSTIKQIIRECVVDSDSRNNIIKLLEDPDRVKSIFSKKRDLKIIEIFPDGISENPLDILDFNSKKAEELIQHGQDKAKEVFEKQIQGAQNDTIVF